MNKTIEVVPYNPKWPEIFTQESSLIQQALGDNCIAVHHIGSTSVPGLSAKPKVDIIAIVKELTTIIKTLETIGYKYRGEFNIPMHYGFNKRGDIKVNLHVYQDGNPEIELNLIFRNYLREHKAAKAEYAKLKQNLLAKESSHTKNNSMFTGYNLGKNDFITKILQKAGFDKLRLIHCTHYAEWDAYHRIRTEQIFKPINVIYDKNHPSLRAENNYHFVLYKGIQIVTVAQIEFLTNTEAALRSLATDEPYKNYGYACYMVNLLEKWLILKGAKIIKLHSAMRAKPFYRKLGYTDMPFDEPSIGIEIVNLGKIL